MAQAPSLRNISTDQLDSDPKKAIGQLVELLNPVLSSTSIGMNRGLNLNDNLNVVQKDFTIKVPEASWTPMTLLNSWVNTAGEPTASYLIDDDGVVHIKGVVKNGLAANIASLPPGYRPPENIRFAVDDNGAYGCLVIGSNGDVTQVSGTTAFLSINTSYHAKDPVGPLVFAGGDWPLLIDSGQGSPIQDVKLGLVSDIQGKENHSFGAAGVHWELGPAGKVIIRRISRLTPGRSYKIRLLLYPTS